MSVSDEADKEDMSRAVDIISRTMTMDRLVPSFQNVVTQAGIKVGIFARIQLNSVPLETHRRRQDQQLGQDLPTLHPVRSCLTWFGTTLHQ